MSTRDKEPPASKCSDPPSHRFSAIKSLPAVALFVILTVVALAGDLLSKHVVFTRLLDDPSLAARVEGLRVQHGSDAPPPERMLAQLQLHRQVFPGVRFTLSTNPGVVFGMPMPWLLVSAATLVAVVLVCLFFTASDARAHWTHVALALIAAGALGNLYDRLFAEVVVPGLPAIRHQVRDFIDCSQIGYKWIFNVADAYLVVGVAMLVLHWLYDGRKAAKARKSDGR